MKTAYLDVIALVERLHRQFLEVVKLELDTHGVHDINNVQAMILYNIGDLEMTVGELTLRGCYLGSNVSYNVKKMLENGYIVQERSPHDRRSVRVRLSEKGLALHAKLGQMHERHIGQLGQVVAQVEDLVAAHKTLRRLERFWTHAVELGSRAAQFPPAA
jgi:DNA-binding MarR family transcriptional regulator